MIQYDITTINGSEAKLEKDIAHWVSRTGEAAASKRTLPKESQRIHVRPPAVRSESDGQCPLGEFIRDSALRASPRSSIIKESKCSTQCTPQSQSRKHCWTPSGDLGIMRISINPNYWSH